MRTDVLLLVASALVLFCACDNTPSSNSTNTQKPGAKAPASKVTTEVKKETPEFRLFPEVAVPSVYGNNQEETKKYVLEHYWDAFFKGDQETTPVSILGVEDGNFEQALANYIQILHVLKAQSTPDEPEPFNQGRESVRHFFKQLENKQLADTSAKTYLRLTEKVTSYLYDPNSPMRDEDFYLPFVEGMIQSPCTRDEMRNAYRHELSQCKTNGFGRTAANFGYKDASGNKGSLHAIHADYTMLFFSNPGCNSCKEIINDIRSCGCINPMIADKRLAIVNIYIDEEVQKWREYLPNYPKNWLNGYDYTFSLRDSGTYDIRAIPSLYLLDSKKRVLLKDAPTRRVLDYLETIYNQ